MSNSFGGGGLSNTLSISVGNAPLALTGLSPLSVAAGSPGYFETVVGTGFTAGSTVQWNGSARPTTFVSQNELLAQIGAADVAAAGSASVNVVNTGATSGTTSSATVSITAPPVDAVAFQIDPRHSGTMQFATILSPASLSTTPSWSVNLGAPPSYALIANGMVYVTTNLGAGLTALYALRQSDGGIVWGPKQISGAANASYDAGRVFVLGSTVGSAGTLSAFDATTGASLWSTALTTQYMFSGPPTAANGIVYVTGAGTGVTMYAVDESSGNLVWNSLMIAGNGATPAVTNDGVYASYPCLTYDFRPLTGETVWSNSTGCDGGGGGIGVAANGLYYSPNGFGTYSGMIFNAETGATAGAYTATVPPAIGPQAAYYLQAGTPPQPATLRALSNSSGNILWSFAGDGSLDTSPVLVNNYVFIGSSSGNLYLLDATTGTQLWAANLGAAIPAGAGWDASTPISGMNAGDGLLVVPAGNNVDAFRLSTSPSAFRLLSFQIALPVRGRDRRFNRRLRSPPPSAATTGRPGREKAPPA